MLDDLLRKYNVKYEDLRPDERQTINGWIAALSQGALTVDKVRDYINMMKASVEEAIVNEPEFVWHWFWKVPNRKAVLLKARLQNYMLLEIMLSTPDKIKQKVEQQISNIGNPVG